MSGCILLYLDRCAGATKKVTALEGAKFDINVSLADNLKIYTGKDVLVYGFRLIASTEDSSCDISDLSAILLRDAVRWTFNHDPAYVLSS